MITALYRLFSLLGRWRPTGRPAKQSVPRARVGQRSRLHHLRPAMVARRRSPHLRAVTSDAGMTTAEYAVGTVAAVAFAVVLFKVVQSPAVHTALAAVVTGALRVHM